MVTDFSACHCRKQNRVPIYCANRQKLHNKQRLRCDQQEQSYCTVRECTKEKLGNRNAFLHKKSSYKQESIQQMVQSDDC